MGFTLNTPAGGENNPGRRSMNQYWQMLINVEADDRHMGLCYTVLNIFVYLKNSLIRSILGLFLRKNEW